MRYRFAMFLALLVSPAFAQGAERYDNVRFGYSISVPPDFVGQGDSGDGQLFELPGRHIALKVWGGGLLDFDSEVAARMAQDAAEGWKQTFQAVTPRWANWTAIAGGQLAYQRMIVLCDGQRYAALRVEYGMRDRAEMDPVVEQLAASLHGPGC